MQKITKAIIPAAGLGTRFLPQTKAMPKEMLPIIAKPVIQMVVEDVVAAGVTDVIIVTGSTKRAIEDHFDQASELEDDLRSRGKTKEADEIKAISELANFVYVRQKGLPKGNARPIINAAHLIGDEPFFVLFADDFFTGARSSARQMLEAYEKTGKSVVALIEVDPKNASSYGMAAIQEQRPDGLFRLSELVEKPGPNRTPSNYASVAGYILTPDIFPVLAKEKVGHSGEIVLADAINELAKTDEVYGCLIEGSYHDTGTPQAYLETLINVALETPELEADVREFLEKRLKQ
jgi:UTP--glucose-1-phosphate uridylyltransferase